MPAALTIAGSDSIAGAGIQADLKTFAALGVYGTSAITAVTSQNTTGVGSVFVLPPQVVRAQIECVAQDVAPSAVKTGMLATAEIVAVVAEAVSRLQHTSLVVDPVMQAGTPGRWILLNPDGVSVLRTRLLPMATVVTPNAAEAAVLSGIPVDSLGEAKKAARKIHELGPAAVIIKGGHLSGTNAIDILFDGLTFTEFSTRRLDLGSVHGTGCAFAAAVAAGLALGDDLAAAVERAKVYVTGALEHSIAAGQGARLLNHFWQRLY